MCSITASFDSKRLNKLIKINQYRGTLSHSVTKLTEKNTLVKLNRYKGELKESVDTDGFFTIVHQQAPTDNQSTSGNIHPAEYDRQLLWHNGIIKEEYVKYLQDQLHEDDTWDTKLLLVGIDKFIDKSLQLFLSDIDGSFACLLLYENDLFVFRNELAPLYYSSQLDFSSTKSDITPYLLIPNALISINLQTKILTPIRNFETKHNPYNISYDTVSSNYNHSEIDTNLFKDYDPYK